MTVAKKNDTTEECNNKVTWANVFNHVSDMDACVVCAKPFELKAGTVLRIG